MNYIGIYFSLSNNVIFNTVRYYCVMKRVLLIIWKVPKVFEVVQVYVEKSQYNESNQYQFKCKYLSTAIVFSNSLGTLMT